MQDIWRWPQKSASRSEKTIIRGLISSAPLSISAPRTRSSRTVRELVEKILTIWPGTWEEGRNLNAPYEAHRLTLASEKAERSGMAAGMELQESVHNTIEWYRTAEQPANQMQKFTQEQIEAFVQASQANARLRRHEMPIR